MIVGMTIWTLLAALLSSLVIGSGIAQAVSPGQGRRSRIPGWLFLTCGTLLLLGSTHLMLFRPLH